MNLSKIKTTLSLLLFVATVVAGYLVWQDFGSSDEGKTAKNMDETPIVIRDEVGIEAEGDVSGMVVEKIELKIPDLDRTIKFGVGINMSEKIRQEIVFSIQKISSELKGNYDDLTNWLQLGILRKQIGDYEGALEAWNFAGVLRPNVSTSFLNSADLYAYYLKDRKSAEKGFMDAIKAEPANGFVYFQTAGFYRDILKDTAKAKEVLRQGISAGADPTGDLKSILESL